MKTRRFQSMLMTAILALFLFFVTVAATVTAAAETSTVAEAAVDTEAKVITALTSSNGQLLEYNHTVTIPVGDSEPLNELLWQLLRVYATVEGEASPVTLQVDWDYNSLISCLSTPGVYTHTAAILAEGYTFAEGIFDTMTIVITVTDVSATTEPDVILSFDDLSNRYAFAAAQNSDWQEFCDTYLSGGIWPESWICYTKDGKTLYADIIWENPEPDMSQTGVVMVRGTAALPENAVLAEGISLPFIEVPVSIQAESTLEIWCADADVIYIPWVMGELENRDDLVYMASANGGEWEDAGEWMDTNGESVCIWHLFLTEGSTYQVKVTWDGGETNIFEFTWNGTVTDAGPVEGDRDGGDTNDNQMVSVTQPAPSMPNSNEEPDEPFYEEVTDTYSLLSGTRLLIMRESGEVRFSKQGITITLSDAALDSMNLTDDSRFLIKLEKTEQGFLLSASLNDIPIYSLPDTDVLLPFAASVGDTRFSLQNEQGETVCEGSYDPALGVASFTIQSTGHYTIMDTSQNAIATSATTDIQISGVVIAFVLVAVLLLLLLLLLLPLLLRRWRQ